MDRLISVSAIDAAIGNVENEIGKMQSILSGDLTQAVSSFDSAWKSGTATSVKGCLQKMITDLDTLKTSLTNIETKVNNVKKGTVAANQTNIG